jgi:ureidoglycolate dehydrogenase (NAD+)
MTAWAPSRIAAAASAAFTRRGLSAEHAAYVVQGLLFASARGIDTHGLRLLKTYLAELDGGRALARPRLIWQREKGAVRLLDAGNALGMVAGRVAAAQAAALAHDFGIGAVTVANSNHFGAASYYTVQLAQDGLIGLAFSNSDALVAPHNGLRPLFGTNPLSLAVAGDDDELFCADLATSQVSYSRVKHHRQQGIPLQPGWALAADGTDAALPPAVPAGDLAPRSPSPAAPAGGVTPAEVAALQPLGGYKGQCLGMAVEILCSLLTGMPFDHTLTHLYDPPFDQPRQVAHLLIAIDPAALTDAPALRTRLTQWLRVTRAEPAAGADPVLVPGDPERTAAAERRHLIPLDDADLRLLTALEQAADS